MTANMSTLDRGLRAAFALAVAVLYFTGVIGGTHAIVLAVVAAVLLLTSVVRFCPIYRALGIHSN